MAVLTLKSEEIKSFPPVLREYAGFMSSIKGNGEKTVCEYLLDLRTFFRFYKQLKGFKIKKVGTEEVYDEAIDIEESNYEYEETDEKVTEEE